MRVIYKVIIITVTAMLLLSAVAVGFNTYIFGTLEIRHKSAPQHLYAENSKGKALVIYQPARTDVTKKAALAVANCLQDDGYDVTVNVPGDFLDADVSSYHIVALGTPVYADRGSPLITDYIKRARGLDKTVLMLFTTGFNDTDKAFDGLYSYTQKAKLTKTFKFVLKNGDNDQNIRQTAAQNVRLLND